MRLTLPLRRTKLLWSGTSIGGGQAGCEGGGHAGSAGCWAMHIWIV